MKTNDAGIKLIEKFEGLRLDAYQDSVGVWTIGYGHTEGVGPGQTITEAEAESFLQSDLVNAENAVAARTTGDVLNENQFAALVSFTFNLGARNLQKLLRRGLATVPDRIELFDHARIGGGPLVEMPGLLKRREAERELFLTPPIEDPTTAVTES